MKDKIMWLVLPLGALATAIIFMLVMIFVQASWTPPPVSKVAWDEEPKDGWTFVGRTPGGYAIKKKYFADHGVWIFTTNTKYESISAVPVEVLQRTQAGDRYK